MLTVYRLRWRDAWFCWRLARDPVVRENSLDRKKPGPFKHFSWMRHWHNNSHDEALAFILMIEGERVGLLRLWKSIYYPVEIGIAIHEDHRGEGYGAEAITMGRGLARFWFPGQGLHAQIRVGNPASMTVFERAGFESVDVLIGGIVLMVARPQRGAS